MLLLYILMTACSAPGNIKLGTYEFELGNSDFRAVWNAA